MTSPRSATRSSAPTSRRRAPSGCRGRRPRASAPAGRRAPRRPAARRPAWAGAWTPPTGDAPLVLVSLSSTYMTQDDLLRRITDALGALPVRALVTLGPALDPGVLG